LNITRYPRDLVGYGRDPVHARWPNGAKLAVQFVLNYEEGGESSVLHGDSHSERFLSEIIGAEAYPARHLSMESVYEYGSRAGVWRILREFERRALSLTVFGVAMALERHPDLTQAFVEAGHEIAAHGWRWIHYQNIDEATEADHMRQAVQTIRRLTGSAPFGWYTGRDSPNTRRLVVEHGGFLYDSDYYGDDLPFWTVVRTDDGRDIPHLVVPYALDTNDMRFATAQGFNTGDHFFTYLRDAFDVLYAEGAESPKMMSVGMHCRLLGRPGRFRALQRFLDHMEAHDGVWVCRRLDIARHWIAHHPFSALQNASSTEGRRTTLASLSALPREAFTHRLAGIFEHSPWVAKGAWKARPFASVDALHQALIEVLANASEEQKLALICAHPELAGAEARAGSLTAESTNEQSSAGLDRCTPDELDELRARNRAYRERFGFPFVMAVKGRSKAEILTALATRYESARQVEFDRCLEEIAKIARLRLAALLESA